MSNKRKRNSRRPERRKPAAGKRNPLGPEPTVDEAMDIAGTIYHFAEMVADGKATEAVDALLGWVGTDERAGLRIHYVAVTAPLICMGMINKHFPADLEADDFWVFERLDELDGNSVKDDIHVEVMCQVLVRFLNDEQDTGHDMLTAHLNTHGEQGLFWVGVHGIKCIASLIRLVRQRKQDSPASP